MQKRRCFSSCSESFARTAWRTRCRTSSGALSLRYEGRRLAFVAGADPFICSWDAEVLCSRNELSLSRSTPTTLTHDGTLGSKRSLRRGSRTSSLPSTSSVSLAPLEAVYRLTLAFRRRTLPPFACALGVPDPAHSALRRGTVGRAECGRVGASLQPISSSHPLHLRSQSQPDTWPRSAGAQPLFPHRDFARSSQRRPRPAMVRRVCALAETLLIPLSPQARPCHWLEPARREGESLARHDVSWLARARRDRLAVTDPFFPFASS